MNIIRDYQTDQQYNRRELGCTRPRDQPFSISVSLARSSLVMMFHVCCNMRAGEKEGLVTWSSIAQFGTLPIRWRALAQHLESQRLTPMTLLISLLISNGIRVVERSMSIVLLQERDTGLCIFLANVQTYQFARAFESYKLAT